jgi:hypothetical protein
MVGMRDLRGALARFRAQRVKVAQGPKLLHREMKVALGLTMAVKQTNCKMMKAATV